MQKALIRMAAAVGLLGCIAFVLSIGILGGTAVNGKVVEGQHYLGEHGRYVAVSPETYRLSQWITRVAFVAWVLAVVAFAVLHARPDPAFELWGAATAVFALAGLLVYWGLTAIGLSRQLGGSIGAAIWLGALVVFASGRRSLSRTAGQEPEQPGT